MTIAFISHTDCSKYETPSLHPDTAERMAAIKDQLLASGLDMILRHYDAPEVSDEQLARVHDLTYIKSLSLQAETNASVWLDGDTLMTPPMLQAARRSAGAGVKAVDLVMTDKALHAFCCVRPPGHHAESNKAMGFCLFNNVAVATAHALAEYGLKRVAVIDFDAHHGNGTEQIFEQEDRVMICSTFQHPYYPETGQPSYTGRMINIPLAPGAKSEDFREAVSQYWLPALHAFQPELLIISAGFDGHREDDMSDLKLVEADYGWVTTQLKTIADAYAQGRIVSCLEGGYGLSALGRSVVAHLNAML